jgi:hypothetical protein
MLQMLGLSMFTSLRTYSTKRMHIVVRGDPVEGKREKRSKLKDEPREESETIVARRITTNSALSVRTQIKLMARFKEYQNSGPRILAKKTKFRRSKDEAVRRS